MLWKLRVVQRFTSPQSSAQQPSELCQSLEDGLNSNKNKVLLRKNKTHQGKWKSFERWPCATHTDLFKNNILELVAREHTLVATEQRKCSWFVQCLDAEMPPTFQLEADYLLWLHAPCSARQKISKTGRENKQELQKSF